jgi:hypothetical protein
LFVGGGNQNESSTNSDQYSAVCIKCAQGRDTVIITLVLHKRW